MTGMVLPAVLVCVHSGADQFLLTDSGTGWYNCEARIYRFDTSTDSNIIDAAIVETDESRLKRTLTVYHFSKEQQHEMKKETETSWATDGYIVLPGIRATAEIVVDMAEGSESEDANKSQEVGLFRQKCCIL